jgi:hypothetical protein
MMTTETRFLGNGDTIGISKMYVVQHMEFAANHLAAMESLEPLSQAAYTKYLLEWQRKLVLHHHWIETR